MFFCLDMIAAPDFNSMAMENWGLVTFRETALLYKPGVSTALNKQTITHVVAHELAHMVNISIVLSFFKNKTEQYSKSMSIRVFANYYVRTVCISCFGRFDLQLFTRQSF